MNALANKADRDGLRGWLWWPSGTSHSLAFAIAFVIVTFLGLAEIPGFPSFKDVAAIQTSPERSMALAVAIFLANAWLLFRHARGDYLAARNGIGPMLRTLLLLSIAFPIAWAASRVLFKAAALPDLAALSHGDRIEWSRLARSIFVGQGGLALVLLYSGLWRSVSYETAELCGAWDRSKPLLKRVFRGGPFLDSGEHDRLIGLLTVLKEGATKLDTRALMQADLRLAGKLAGSADTVLKVLNVTTGGLPNLRKQRFPAVNFLLGEGEP